MQQRRNANKYTRSASESLRGDGTLPRWSFQIAPAPPDPQSAKVFYLSREIATCKKMRFN
jgi:hypothetical protein